MLDLIVLKGIAAKLGALAAIIWGSLAVIAGITLAVSLIYISCKIIYVHGFAYYLQSVLVGGSAKFVQKITGLDLKPDNLRKEKSL